MHRMENLVTSFETLGITLYVQCFDYDPKDNEIDGIHALTAVCNPHRITALEFEIDKRQNRFNITIK